MLELVSIAGWGATFGALAMAAAGCAQFHEDKPAIVLTAMAVASACVLAMSIWTEYKKRRN